MENNELYNIVKEKLSNDGINYNDFHVLIISKCVLFNGQLVPNEIPNDIKFTQNSVRLLVPIEDCMTSDIYYCSTEYEIYKKITTFLPCGNMNINSTIYLLK